jgi:hypothetical protein
MQIELDANSTNDIRELAAILHKTPEQTAEEMVAYAMHRARRYSFYLKNVHTVPFYLKNVHTVPSEQGLEILRGWAKVPPDLGDELPQDLLS